MHYCNMSYVVCAVIFYGFSLPMVMGDEDVPFEQICSELVERKGQFDTGSLEFRQYQFLLPDTEYDQLRQILISTHSSPQTDLVSSVEDILDDPELIKLRGWHGNLYFDDDHWRVIRNINEEFDTLEQTNAQLAADAGFEPVPVVHQDDIAFDGQIESKILDRDTLFLNEVSADFTPQAELDISLNAWDKAIEVGANPEQIILGEVDGNRHRITYKNNAGTANESWGTYVFDSSLDFSGIKTVVYDTNQELWLEVLHGFQPQSVKRSSAHA